MQLCGLPVFLKLVGGTEILPFVNNKNLSGSRKHELF